MLVYGKLSDLYGRKLLFQAAIVIFLIGSLLSGVSQNMMQLIASRGVQGLGAGGIMILSQAVIGDIMSPRERGRYQGYMGSVFGVSSVAGPLIGGFFTDNLTWRWVFFVNIPVGVAALIVTAFVLRLPVHRFEHGIDYRGAFLMIARHQRAAPAHVVGRHRIRLDLAGHHRPGHSGNCPPCSLPVSRGASARTASAASPLQAEDIHGLRRTLLHRRAGHARLRVFPAYLFPGSPRHERDDVGAQAASHDGRRCCQRNRHRAA